MTNKPNLLERLKQGPLLADGAMGTMLFSHGIRTDACLEQLNLTRPDLILEIHRAYLDAGADVIETNTFGANHYRLATHGLEGKVAAFNRAGVSVARQAINDSGRDAYLLASVGPLGVQLEPFGRVTKAQAYDAFRDQLVVLAETGIDGVQFETFTDLRELIEAVRAARDTLPEDIAIIAQMSFTRDDRTLLGDTPADVARDLAEAGAHVVGINCSNGPSQARRIIRMMQKADSSLLLSAQPNAGWPENIGGRITYAARPDYFAQFAATMRDYNVDIIGGCCGTTPEHTAAMRIALDDPTIEGFEEIRVHLPRKAEPVPPSEAPSELAQKLGRGDFVVAVEVSPPKGIATEKVLRAARLLRESGADVIDVTDSPMARMRMSPWAVCHLIEQQAGIETVLHFPTRGRNLLRVQGDLLAAHALGIRNLFVVMGDPTRIGDYPEAADNYDVVPSGLVKLIKQSLNRGEDYGGNAIGQPTNFLVSSALNLNAPDLDREIKVLRKKLENGADYLLTQPVYDPGIYTHFMEAYEAQHGPLDVPVLVGLMPLYSTRHASFLDNEVPGISIPEAIMKRMADAGDDAKQEGVRIAIEIAQALQPRITSGGLYIIPQYGRYDLAAQIIEAVRQRTA